MNSTNSNEPTKPDTCANAGLADVFYSILNHFTDCKYREWMASPFNVGEKTVATNGVMLVATPNIFNYEDKSEKTKSVYPMVYNMEKVIQVKEIVEGLKNFPKVDCYDVEEIKCDACNGDGEVEFEFYYKGSHTIEVDCPICEGDGIIEKTSKKPNGKKELDCDKYFQIGKCFFHPNRIEELAFIIERLNVSEITLVNQTEETKPCLFKVGDVEVIIAPVMCSNPDSVAVNIG